MALVRGIVSKFVGGDDSPALALAQWRALSRQIPLLYFLLLSNTLIVAGMYLPVAPFELTILVPGILTVLCVVRTIQWWLKRNRDVTTEEARRTLAKMVVLGAALALGFTAWSFSLFPYGDAYLQSQVAFYMGITTIGCMFCLMHVRAGALAVGVCVVVPFTIFFAATGQPTFIAISINMVMVIAVLLIILLGNNKDFAALVASRNEMANRQAETQRLLDENHRLANVDTLTGIPNRRSFTRQLHEALGAAEQNGRSIAVARIDLDRFKSVNEIFGKITGDRILVEIARRIESIKRDSSILARLDGDNFVLILQEPTDEASLVRCGEMIAHALRPSFDMPLGTVRLSASCGFAAARKGDTADTLFDRADYATWVAKRDGRARSVVFSGVHQRELQQVRLMENLLHTADLEREIYILLQPQFDVALGRTTGFEVLARWRNPLLGEVSPADFIPMAERTGQISRITQVVLQKALIVAEQLPRPLRLSVNLSANDIGSSAAIEQIAALVGAAASPCRIDFEITETAVLRDLKQANQSLLTLLGLGARIALDDFGTGHSSLTHVQKLPLHRIKIDRSFVAEVTCDPASRAIVKTMIDLCRNLGISCVFEGIETEEQLEALLGLGGTVMQGYLFGRPMACDQIETYLDSERRRVGVVPQPVERAG
ncbi:Phytochrome-like protein cph2 [Devosia equisanguinis]|uniref:Phytochrome-like protein cph2 n=1 Tax=Devosia equisanguinis TaxID=2490941 RepID=A0A3S4CCV3_9HYPH|nr:EAL domain-containing protein [Devosia equisanguinis]VDS05233.1 Phytochrome-like protein cph2 [Devosia equisanguinis]